MANLSMHFMRHFCSKTIYKYYKYTFSNFFAVKRQISCSSSVYNTHRKYSDKHEWVTVNENIGTVGITNYAQESLGEVVYVQPPDIGSECRPDEHVGVIESVKAVNELCSPVSGNVTEVNSELEEKPGLVNESCYDEGWIFKLELKDPSEMDNLMTEKQYEEYLKAME